LIKKDAESPGVEPTEKTVQSGEYPIARHLFIYVNPALDKDGLNAYLKWIISDEGQKVVKDVGYFPFRRVAHSFRKRRKAWKLVFWSQSQLQSMRR